MNLAFVLLSEAHLPEPKDVIAAYSKYAAPGETLQEVEDQEEIPETGSEKALMLQMVPGGQAVVGVMPHPVPEGEADEAVRFSLSALSKGWELPEHHAHLLVTVLSPEDEPPPEEALSRFTSLLAAVAEAGGAVGIYWGNAGATHEPQMFMDIAADDSQQARIVLWTGVSIAREEDGRLSFLSLGMDQLNLPDLLLVAGDEEEPSEVLMTFFDLLSFMVQREEAPPEGDTVGRSEDERLPVHYVASPLDPDAQVWRVELS